MNTWTEVKRFDVRGFTVIVDIADELLHPSELYDPAEYDVHLMAKAVASGELLWFMLRARVEVEGIELGSDSLGGLCYEQVDEVFEDGVADDVIYGALKAARIQAGLLKRKLVDMGFD